MVAAHSACTTWCGAGSTGRSSAQAAIRRSVKLPPAGKLGRPEFIGRAAAYHTISSTARTTPTGTICASPCLLVIGVSGAQPLPYAMRHGEKFGRVADVERALARKCARDDIDDAPRARRHD